MVSGGILLFVVVRQIDMVRTSCGPESDEKFNGHPNGPATGGDGCWLAAKQVALRGNFSRRVFRKRPDPTVGRGPLFQ